MQRFHLFAIHDQAWCPRAIRDAETGYLQFVTANRKGYAAVVSVLAAALQRTATRQVLDLCSGARGPWLRLGPVLAKQSVAVSVCLTDKFPNPALGPPGDGPEQSIRCHPWPADYWQLWSDQIIHRIHLRVLNQVKQLSENEP